MALGKAYIEAAPPAQDFGASVPSPRHRPRAPAADWGVGLRSIATDR